MDQQQQIQIDNQYHLNKVMICGICYGTTQINVSEFVDDIPSKEDRIKNINDCINYLIEKINETNNNELCGIISEYFSQAINIIYTNNVICNSLKRYYYCFNEKTNICFSVGIILNMMVTSNVYKLNKLEHGLIQILKGEYNIYVENITCEQLSIEMVTIILKEMGGVMNRNYRSKIINYMNTDTLFLSNETLDWVDNDIISFKILAESDIIDIMKCSNQFSDYSLIGGIAFNTTNKKDECVYLDSLMNQIYVFKDSGMIEKLSLSNCHQLNFKLLFWMKKRLYFNADGIVNIHYYNEKKEDNDSEEDNDYEEDNDLDMINFVNVNDNENIIIENNQELILPLLDEPGLATIPLFPMNSSMFSSITPLPMHHAPPPLQQFQQQSSEACSYDNSSEPSNKKRKLTNGSQPLITTTRTTNITTTTNKNRKKVKKNKFRGKWHGKFNDVINKLKEFGRGSNELCIRNIC